MNSVRSSAGRKSLRRLAAVGLALALALPMAGCSDEQKPKSAGSPGAQQTPSRTDQVRSVPMSLLNGKARIELRALSRTSDKVVTGHLRLVNEGQVALQPWLYLHERGNVLHPGLGDIYSTTGIGLLDGRNNKLYLPLQRTEGTARVCFCSRLFGTKVAPGGSIDVYAMFPAPPADVRQITVTMPYAQPFADVPIAQGQLKPLPDQTIDPATATPPATPRILDLTSIAEGIEQSVDDAGDNRSVRLSDDVLFALNKADLTPRATALLQQLAKQIDASTSTTVKVDGHTDTSGNDAINQPLSERRAKAVADQMKALVTRSGVAYQVAGHGSKEPVASNNTDEGRRKNRRTTVQFARPKPPAPSGQNNTGASQLPKTATLKTSESNGLKVEINSFRRDSNGAAIMTWTLRNTGQTGVNIPLRLEKTLAHGNLPPRRDYTVGGVMLVDPAQKIRYESAFSGSGACTCSSIGGGENNDVLGPGQSISLWNLYKPSPETRAVDVQFSWGNDPKAAVVTGLSLP